MILIITSQEDATADLVEKRLRERGAEHWRFNTEDYPTKVQIDCALSKAGTQATLRSERRTVRLADVQTVWYRRPAAPLISDDVAQPEARQFAEQEGRAVLSGVYSLLQDAFWVSRPNRIREAEVKLHQLTVAASLGLDIPDTLVTNDPDAARAFYRKWDGQVIVKPMKAGRIAYPDGTVELIYTNPLTPADLRDMARVAYAPCLFQAYVPKEFEVRVTVIGDALFAVGLDSQAADISKHDWRRENSTGVRYFEMALPDAVVSQCLAFVKAYGLAFSAIDLVHTPDGEYVFLENNPNGQWAWLDLELGNGMIDAMCDLLMRGAADGA